MSNKKQSSVEHFWQQLEEKGNAHIETEGVITVNITIDVNEYRLLKKETKAMHKEEIINAVQSCGYIGGATDEEAEQYYNETFGGNK